MQQPERKGILILKDFNEEQEIEFELDFLLSLSAAQRFFLMQQKSRELIENLEKNGHRRTTKIIKRK